MLKKGEYHYFRNRDNQEPKMEEYYRWLNKKLLG